MKTLLYRILWYVKESQEDEFGQFSGKRALGTLCILIGLGLSFHAEFGACACIASRILVSGMVFSVGLAFWGITSVASYFNNKLQSTETISKKAIEEDSTNTNIEIKQP